MVDTNTTIFAGMYLGREREDIEIPLDSGGIGQGEATLVHSNSQYQESTTEQRFDTLVGTGAELNLIAADLNQDQIRRDPRLAHLYRQYIADIELLVRNKCARTERELTSLEGEPNLSRRYVRLNVLSNELLELRAEDERYSGDNERINQTLTSVLETWIHSLEQEPGTRRSSESMLQLLAVARRSGLSSELGSQLAEIIPTHIHELNNQEELSEQRSEIEEAENLLQSFEILSQASQLSPNVSEAIRETYIGVRDELIDQAEVLRASDSEEGLPIPARLAALAIYQRLTNTQDPDLDSIQERYDSLLADINADLGNEDISLANRMELGQGLISHYEGMGNSGEIEIIRATFLDIARGELRQARQADNIGEQLETFSRARAIFEQFGFNEELEAVQELIGNSLAAIEAVIPEIEDRDAAYGLSTFIIQQYLMNQDVESADRVWESLRQQVRTNSEQGLTTALRRLNELAQMGQMISATESQLSGSESSSNRFISAIQELEDFATECNLPTARSYGQFMQAVAGNRFAAAQRHYEELQAGGLGIGRTREEVLEQAEFRESLGENQEQDYFQQIAARVWEPISEMRSLQQTGFGMSVLRSSIEGFYRTRISLARSDELDSSVIEQMEQEREIMRGALINISRILEQGEATSTEDAIELYEARFQAHASEDRLFSSRLNSISSQIMPLIRTEGLSGSSVIEERLSIARSMMAQGRQEVNWVSVAEHTFGLAEGDDTSNWRSVVRDFMETENTHYFDETIGMVLTSLSSEHGDYEGRVRTVGEVLDQVIDQRELDIHDFADVVDRIQGNEALRERVASSYLSREFWEMAASQFTGLNLIMNVGSCLVGIGAMNGLLRACQIASLAYQGTRAANLAMQAARTARQGRAAMRLIQAASRGSRLARLGVQVGRFSGNSLVRGTVGFAGKYVAENAFRMGATYAYHQLAGSSLGSRLTEDRIREMLLISAISMPIGMGVDRGLSPITRGLFSSGLGESVSNLIENQGPVIFGVTEQDQRDGSVIVAESLLGGFLFEGAIRGSRESITTLTQAVNSARPHIANLTTNIASRASQLREQAEHRLQLESARVLSSVTTHAPWLPGQAQFLADTGAPVLVGSGLMAGATGLPIGVGMVGANHSTNSDPNQIRQRIVQEARTAISSDSTDIGEKLDAIQTLIELEEVEGQVEEIFNLLRSESLLFNSDPNLLDIRINAISLLSQIGTAVDKPRFERLLGSSNAQIRRNAIQGLGRVGGGESFEILFEIVNNDPEGGCRQAAIEAISELRDADVIHDLLVLKSCNRELPEEQALVARILGQGLHNFNLRRVAGILERLSADPNTSVRIAAVQALINLGQPYTYQRLLEMVTDSNIGVRAEVARALGCIEPGQYRDQVIAALIQLSQEDHPIIVDNETEELRVQAARSLGSLGGERAFNRLMEMSREGMYIYSVVAASHALGELGDSRATERLIELLNYRTPYAGDSRDYRDSQVCQTACQALGRINTANPSPRITNALAQVLGQDGNNFYFDLAAAKSLAAVGNSSGLEWIMDALSGDNAVEVVRALADLDNPDSEFHIDNPRITARLLDLFANSSNMQIREIAALALARRGEPRIVQELELSRPELLSEEARIRVLTTFFDNYTDEQDQQEAEPQSEPVSLDLSRLGLTPRAQAALQAVIQRLGLNRASVATDLQERVDQVRLGHEEAITYAIQVLDGLLTALNVAENQEHALELIEALGYSGSQQAVDVFIRALESQDAQISRRALAGLVRIGGEQANQSVINYILSHLGNSLSIIANFADCLRQADNSELLLRQLLADSQNQNSIIRDQTIILLGEVGGNTAIELLTRLLNDSDTEIQSLAALKLAEAGNDSGLDILLEIVGDDNEGESIRSNILDILGQLGDRRAVPILISILNNPNQKIHSIRAKSIIALGELGDTRAILVLSELLKDENMSEYAIRALAGIGGEQAETILIDYFQDVDPNNYVYGLIINVLSNNFQTNRVRQIFLELNENPPPGLTRVVGDIIREAIFRWDFDENIETFLEQARATTNFNEASIIAKVLGELNAARPVSDRITDSQAADNLYSLLVGGRSNNQVFIPNGNGGNTIYRGIISLGEGSYIGDLLQTADSNLQTLTDAFDSRHFEAVLEVFNDQSVDENVISRAAQVLGYIGDRRAVPHLLRQYGEGATLVDFFIIPALSQIGDDRAVPLLTPFADAVNFDSESMFMDYYQRALTQIGGQRVVDALVEQLNSADILFADADYIEFITNILLDVGSDRIVHILENNPHIPENIQRRLLSGYLDRLGEENTSEAGDLARLIIASTRRNMPGSGNRARLASSRAGDGDEFRQVSVISGRQLNGTRNIDWRRTAGLPPGLDGTTRFAVREYDEPNQQAPVTVAVHQGAYEGGWQNLAIAAGTLFQLSGADSSQLLINDNPVPLPRRNRLVSALDAVLRSGSSQVEESESVLTMLNNIARSSNRGMTVYLVANFYGEDLEALNQGIRNLKSRRQITVVPVQIGDSLSLPSTEVKFGSHSFRVPPSIERAIQQSRVAESHPAVVSFLNNNHGISVPINSVSSSADLPGRIMMELLRPPSSREYGEVSHVEIQGDRTLNIDETNEPPENILSLFQEALDQSVEGNIMPLSQLVHTAQMMGWTFVFDLLRSEMQRVGMDLAVSSAEGVETDFEQLRSIGTYHRAWESGTFPAIPNEIALAYAMQILDGFRDRGTVEFDLEVRIPTDYDLSAMNPHEQLWWQAIRTSLENNDEESIFGLPRFVEAALWGPSELTLLEFMEARNRQLEEDASSAESAERASVDSPGLLENLWRGVTSSVDAGRARDQSEVPSFPRNQGANPNNSGLLHQTLEQGGQPWMTFDHPERLLAGAGRYLGFSMAVERNEDTLGFDTSLRMSLDLFTGGGGERVRGRLARGVQLSEDDIPFAPLNGRVADRGGVFNPRNIYFELDADEPDSELMDMTVAEFRQVAESRYGDNYSMLTDAFSIDGLPEVYRSEIENLIADDQITVRELVRRVQEYTRTRFQYRTHEDLNETERHILEDHLENIRNGEAQQHDDMLLMYRLQGGVCAEFARFTNNVLRLAGIPAAIYNTYVATNEGVDNVAHQVAVVVLPRAGQDGRWQALPVETTPSYVTDSLLDMFSGNHNHVEDNELITDEDENGEDIVNGGDRDQVDSDAHAPTDSAQTDVTVLPELVEGSLDIIENELQIWWQEATEQERIRLDGAFRMIEWIMYVHSADPRDEQAISLLRPYDPDGAYHISQEAIIRVSQSHVRLVGQGLNQQRTPREWINIFQQYIGQRVIATIHGSRTMNEEDILYFLQFIAQTS